MRDTRFVAEHRGGPLSQRHHRQLAAWAAACAGHILSRYWKNHRDTRPRNAVRLAQAWVRGAISVGEARQAAVAAHAAARAAEDLAAIAAARAAGHAVATAHMADHCLGAAGYALKAVAWGGGSPTRERQWQDRRVPPPLRKLIKSARSNRGADIIPKPASAARTAPHI